MKRALLVALMLWALVGCEPGPSKLLLVGDSLTSQYKAQMTVYANRIGGNGENAYSDEWPTKLQQATDNFARDVIVLQDYCLPGYDTDATVEQWHEAWRQLVFVANASGARVITLVGCCDPVFMESLPTEHLDMEPADAPDGIHYTPEGAKRMAERLEAVL
jgi:hypothetical protein